MRVPLLQRLGRRSPEMEPAEEPGTEATVEPDQSAPPPTKPPRRRSAPPAGTLRRERRALLRLREEKLRDLGGLALEMYRRDRFREDLLLERCADLIGLEARIHELDALLGDRRAGAAMARAARCDCGAPLLWGSRFCANCGRPVPAAADGSR